MFEGVGRAGAGGRQDNKLRRKSGGRVENGGVRGEEGGG